MTEQVDHGPTYPKILSIFERHKEKPCHFIEGQWREPWIEYLKDNVWCFTEKIDGTNIRVHWDGERVRFGGRTDKAQIPVFLYDKLEEMFPNELVASIAEGPMTLYGEGYGARIQKGGGNYIQDGVDFILFDVRCGDWWLRRDDIYTIADRLGIQVVPLKGEGTIADAISYVRDDGVISYFGDFMAEGLVLRPKVELKTRSGHRVIVN